MQGNADIRIVRTRGHNPSISSVLLCTAARLVAPRRTAGCGVRPGGRSGGRRRAVILCGVVGEREAMAAAECHLRALAERVLDMSVTGVFNGWRWWRGSSRAVWLPPSDDAVYKIEWMRFGTSNDNEHEQMTKWRREGWTWAPKTWLFTVDCPGLTSPKILAMPYYPCPVSPADIPRSALRRVPDLLPANFARRYGGPVMVIDAGELVPG